MRKNNRRTIENNRKLKTVITHEIMEILTYFFLQIFMIFDGLSDSSKKSYGNSGVQLSLSNYFVVGYHKDKKGHK